MVRSRPASKPDLWYTNTAGVRAAPGAGTTPKFNAEEKAVPEKYLKPGFHLEWVASATSSPGFLSSIASSPESWVRESVAGHASTAPETLAAMVPANSESTANARLLPLLAANLRTPVESLSAIAELVRASFGHRVDRRVADAGHALFERPDTPTEVVLSLLDDPEASTDFRLTAASTATRLDVLERLRSDVNDRVRKAAGRNPLRPLVLADITGAGGLVERAVRTRRSTTGSIYGGHFIGPLERLLTDIHDDTYLVTLDAVALDIARSFDDGVVTFWDADDLIGWVWVHMVNSPRDRPFADIATAVYEAFDAGGYDHGDGLDPTATYTEPEIRRILAATIL